MRNKINILSMGTEIKLVGKPGRVSVPKELVGRYIRVSLLPIGKEIELIRKVQNSIKYKKEKEKADKILVQHYKKLNRMRNGK